MDTDPLVGQVLDGRYRVQSRIARGGMATVYVGHDTKLDRTVALKVMHANLASDEDFVRRFIGEAKHAAALSHPNVVAVYDQGTDRGHVFLAMEYVPGRNLRDLLNERGRLGPREALQVMQPILSALGSAHRAGLIHRDVKPENVLLTEDGQIKVADFGLARAESATKQTKTGMLIGTVGYVAPEQVISGNADARTDVYSAGIMLFELLTGRQPHQGETPLSVAYKHVNEVVPLPSSVIRGLPPRLDALVASATNHDPARRPADADHFLNAAAEVFRSLPHDIDAILASAAPMPVEHATRALPAPHLMPSAPPHDATQTLNPHTMVVSPAEQTAPQPGPSLLRTRRPLLYAGIAAGVVVVLLLGWLVWSQTLGNYETVPQLAGKSEEQARVAAEQVGLKVKRGPERYDEKAPKGTVADVRPKPGSDVKRGSILTLILSKGRPPVEIPQVAGLPVEEAKKRLQEKGLRVDETDEQASTTVPRGSVIKTEPAAGRKQSPDEPVTLVVSIGIKLPDLKGLKRADAEAKVRRLGLNPTFQEQDAAPGQQPGTVIGQNPPPGTPLDKGAQVQITVTKNNCAIPFLCPGDEEGDQAAVPNVVGQPIFMAKSTLEGAGFKVETHGKGLDRVGGQNPPAGAQAPKGSKVTVWGGGRNGG